MRIRYPRQTAVLAAVGTALLLTACGSTPSTATTGGSAAATPVTVTIAGAGTVTTDPALAARVPADARAKGSITVATNAPYAPFIDFKTKGDQSHFVGLDYDLFTAAAARLGLRATFQQQPFDGLVPGLQAGKYDAIAGGVTDKREREQVATFVDYTASGTGFLVTAGNPKQVSTVANLCGLRVGAQKASNQVDNLTAYSKASCPGQPIVISQYPANTDAVQALLAGQVDVVAATRVNLTDVVTQLSGKVALADDPAAPNGWLASPNGFGFLKSRGELATAFQAALQSLISDGTYRKILDQWKQAPIGLATITVNQPIN
ncbi:amino acid ABC transporter [Actinoplanes sp. SE50]|uniref:transporter substrate-binding domain-containing protein n=1 Tax=unclassified Actinoplanes TaxID=2626549 RepID=UPI00023EC623|nr:MULTISPECIES: transporter substrate-binding domain-containing protein [unclassified Actinoplanes]AEV84679.1 Membrane-bound lytic murein transglycosylase F [Actinoplanes sp. SE50/110]ATO83071.1 amino acid ABC transporter [Actinoplanes sp. SE50]SLM00478.1 amino acid ABC transporter [Actinoplanes sp. SE50/110]